MLKAEALGATIKLQALPLPPLSCQVHKHPLFHHSPVHHQLWTTSSKTCNVVCSPQTPPLTQYLRYIQTFQLTFSTYALFYGAICGPVPEFCNAERNLCKTPQVSYYCLRWVMQYVGFSIFLLFSIFLKSLWRQHILAFN